MLIGLAGQARSGKSTLAAMLSKILSMGVAGFATPIREATYEAFAPYLSEADLTDGKDEPLPPQLGNALSNPLHRLAVSSRALRALNTTGFALPDADTEKDSSAVRDLSARLSDCTTPRDILCALGAYYRDHAGSDYWVRRFEERLGDYSCEGGLIVDDVRFPVERDWIRTAGGCLILVQRKGLRLPGSDSDVSELSLGRPTEYHYRIKARTGDLVDLLQKGVRAIGDHFVTVLTEETARWAQRNLAARGVAAINNE